MDNNATNAPKIRARQLFSTRELVIRSGRKVRTLTLTRSMQVAAAGLAVLMIGGLGASTTALLVGQQQTKEERLALESREAKLAGESARVAAYRAELDQVMSDLEQRQTFLEEMAKMLPVDEAEFKGAVFGGKDKDNADNAEAASVENRRENAERAAARVGHVLPQALGLAQIEKRQLALVEELGRFAESRVAKAEASIRQLGLDPRALRDAEGYALGGPLEKLSTEADGSLDPRFERLGLSLAKMDELERGLSRLPQVSPVDMVMVSSGFGFRRDPFTGGGALHAGLDFRGPIGAPIYAASGGKVSFVGMRSGYGKVVEISHGNGLMTRYAHMSAWRAKAGQQVEPGEKIGEIGTTGRSTGPHLHFEVRMNGRAVNPRPFLEMASKKRASA